MTQRNRTEMTATVSRNRNCSRERGGTRHKHIPRDRWSILKPCKNVHCVAANSRLLRPLIFRRIDFFSKTTGGCHVFFWPIIQRHRFLNLLLLNVLGVTGRRLRTTGRGEIHAQTCWAVVILPIVHKKIL